MAAIDVNDPFNFGQELVNVAGAGSLHTGDDVQLGEFNSADDNDTTFINSLALHRAAFAAENLDTGDGTVGVLGKSDASTRAIGVAGQSSTGAGVYGIATDENSKGLGIGVVGRSMGGLAVEPDAVEKMVGEPVGVLGHSMNGSGVRGHGGPLRPIPQGTLTFSVMASPGGVFSSGQLQDQVIPPASAAQRVSLDTLPQLRLIPSVASVLPTKAQMGDLFMAILPASVTHGGPRTGALFICTSFVDGTPIWQQVQLGPAVTGGSPLG